MRAATRIGLLGRAGNVRARRDVGIAALPRVRVSGRLVRPVALARGEHLTDLRDPGDRRSRGVHRHGTGRSGCLGHDGRSAPTAAEAEPSAFVAVTLTLHRVVRRPLRRACRSSASPCRSFLHAFPSALQRSHAYANDVGVLLHVPSLAVSTWPTWAACPRSPAGPCRPARPRQWLSRRRRRGRRRATPLRRRPAARPPSDSIFFE